MQKKMFVLLGMLLSFVAGGLLVGGLSYFGPFSSLGANVHANPVPAKLLVGTPPSPWLKGTPEEQLSQLERHGRGLDIAMLEINYRYGELLKASKDSNWDFAKYQAEKIDVSLRLAVERRPRRAKSSAVFLKEGLPPTLEAIKARAGEKFDASLKTLLAGCIQCHRAENVLFMSPLFASVQPTPPAMAKVVEEYRKKLPPDSLRGANRSRGRLVFSKNCTNCHRFFEDGTANGPDLTGLKRSDLDYLVSRIVNPNALIGKDYQAIVVVTKKGQTLTGLVKQEDRQTLTLQQEKEPVTIPRDEIEQRSLSRASFMPEGLLQKMNDEEVRDLFAYLLGTEQVPLP